MAELNERLKQAVKCSERKNYSEALKLCCEVISEDPSDPSGYRERSHIYALMNQMERAIHDIDHVIRLRPEEPAHYFTRGRWQLDVDEFAQAVKDLTKVIELSVFYGDDYYMEMARFFRAEALLRLGRYEEALADCEQVRDEVQTYIHPRVKSKGDIVEEANARRAARPS